ncbi:class I SAM-dependent methyltransferase [bacterium]|nr:class I SAM-dependent methyltransferase [bacterium]
MKIAVYTLTMNRLDFTKHCFATWWEKAGCTFDQYVFDQGSTDGTAEWLRANEKRFSGLVLSDKNVGISRASNAMLDMIAERGGCDLVMRIDNDCEFETDGLLAKFRDLLLGQADWRKRFGLAPRVTGLVHQPARHYYESISGHKVGVTNGVGGIIHPVPWDIMKGYRYPLDIPFGSGDDVHLCRWLVERGVMVGYVEDLVVNHYLTTVGQWNRERTYFARKDREDKKAPAPPASGPIREIRNESPTALPVTVVVPLSDSRRAFFEDFALPSILANEPELVVLVEGAGGSSPKRNAGFARVKSPFVFFCDDDVILARVCLRTLHRALSEPEGREAGYAYCDYVGIAIPPGAHPLGPVFFHKGKPFDARELKQGNIASTMTLIRSSVFPGFDESVMRLQDWDLWLTLLEKGVVGVHVPASLFHDYHLDAGITARVDGDEARSHVRQKHGLADAEGDMAVSDRTVEVLDEVAKSWQLATVVELGTGAGRSLEVLTKRLRRHARVFSVDDDVRFLENARARLEGQALSVGQVHLVHAPLGRGTFAGVTQDWYSETALAEIPGPIDLLFVDGPQGHVGRFPAVPAFLDRLSPRAAIVLDDANRDDERRILAAWAEILRSRGHELVLDLFPTDRGLGRIQLLGAVEERDRPPETVREPARPGQAQAPASAETVPAEVASAPRSWVIDADDFCEDNHGFELLTRIKREIPRFKINLFTIVGRCSDAFLAKVKALDWIDMLPHGLFHETPHETENWSFEESCRYLDRIERLGLTKGFKAPGWLISGGTYRALLERGYWVADQRRNDGRRPKTLRSYHLDAPDGKPYPDRRHYHIQNVCGNGLAERLDEILALRGEFHFIRDLVLEGGEVEKHPIVALPENAITLDRLIKLHGFRRGAELGVRRGELTASLLGHNPGLSMIAVDLWGDHPILNEKNDHEGNYEAFRRNVRGLEDRVTAHRMVTLDAAKLVPDASLDFVFIDATHTYAALKDDILAWAPKVKPSGMLTGHDYHPHFDHGGMIRCIHDTFVNPLVDEWTCWFAWRRDLRESALAGVGVT